MQPILAKQHVEETKQPEADDFYPDSDGKPMSDNTLQFEWITLIKSGLEFEFSNDTNVFVAGDLLWYPVEGNNKIRQAPDVMVAMGRPKGYRGSYKQFQEEGIAPQVVFEILSPGNRLAEMIRKYEFYEEYGVLEYYVYDPHKNTLEAYSRDSADAYWIDIVVKGFSEWKSGILGIHMTWDGFNFRLFHRDKTPFLSYNEVGHKYQITQLRAKEAELKLKEIELAIREAKLEKEEANLKAQKLAEKLRSLGIDPDSI
ncbi:Uma2 family endonuclease [Haliscomenobacter hydrossis]|uniref:Putative restriction endonuclease domain-containing protein n=1 Tax=Haliscomenobacter hydrossis (strain ATCC 27775 / DSM 1100 / LMG 10767 / O) TaxID=760192 RepID=F4KW59_HALH1|nr:Uma2 family endonuclease [Haliscomenobacter hydrossis]AEE49247.1 protein of unknown function DUF820 [Haliscomenobacter hydrossis DSM 1100]